MTLYTSSSCVKCPTVKYFLKKNDVDYEEKDVSIEENMDELIKLTGYMTVPVFVKGENVVIGANLSFIKQLIA